MTTLIAPPSVGERQTSNHDCGPACLASILEWAGLPELEPTVAQWMTDHGLDSSGTSPGGLAQYCSSIQVPSVVDVSSYMSNYVPACLDRGHLCIGLHQCNGNAVPVPRGSSSIAHWRVFYGDDNGQYQTMNPWTAVLEALPQATFAAADLHQHLEVNLEQGGDMLLYQQTNGTISLLTGGKLINLGAVADVTYLESLSLKLALESKLTPAFAANIAAAVAAPAAGGLTAAQAAALAEIPTILTKLIAIEANLNAAKPPA